MLKEANHRQQNHTDSHISADSHIRGFQADERAGQPLHKEEQDSHRKHQADIRQGTAKDCLCQIFSSLPAQCKFFLKIFTHAFPPTFHSTDLW